MVHVTAHAVDRYRQRVESVTPEQAREAILNAAPVIEIAAGFGCDCVVLGCGARLRLDGTSVVTVLGKRQGKASRHG